MWMKLADHDAQSVHRHITWIVGKKMVDVRNMDAQLGLRSKDGRKRPQIRK
jgi:hypothetical protein